MHYIIDKRRATRLQVHWCGFQSYKPRVLCCARHTSLRRHSTRTQFIALTLPAKLLYSFFLFFHKYEIQCNDMNRVGTKAMKLDIFILKNTLILENRVTKFFLDNIIINFLARFFSLTIQS